MRTFLERKCLRGTPKRQKFRLFGDRSVNGGGPRTTLPWDATQHIGPVLDAKGPSPARRIAVSSCRPRPASGGEGPKRGVGSEGLTNIVEDMERPEQVKAVRESSYVLSSGFHQRAFWLGNIALASTSRQRRTSSNGKWAARKLPFRYRAPSPKNFGVRVGGGS